MVTLPPPLVLDFLFLGSGSTCEALEYLERRNRGVGSSEKGVKEVSCALY